MLAFFAVALAEVLVGVYVCLVYRPTARRNAIFYRKLIGTHQSVSGRATDPVLVKKANFIALKICVVSALLTLADAGMHKYLGVVDLEEVLLVATMLVVLPVRHAYIARNDQ